MKLQIVTLSAMAALALAACEPAAESGGETAAAAGDAATPAAAAADGGNTALRTGLWQVTTNIGGAPAISSQMCVDEQMNALSSTMNQQAGTDCDQTVNETADGMVFNSVCRMGEVGGETRTEGRLSGDRTNTYRIDAEITTTGAAYAALNGTQTMVTEGAYQGACPSGWRGGDIEVSVMGQSHRVNIHDTMAEEAARVQAAG